jgi:hypothetical protein
VTAGWVDCWAARGVQWQCMVAEGAGAVEWIAPPVLLAVGVVGAVAPVWAGFCCVFE